MYDVFVSYDRLDVERARLFVRAFETRGLTVFWDQMIPPGENWAKYIEKSLGNCCCLVVLWTKHSVASGMVVDEARDAHKRGNLIPVMLDSLSEEEIPFGLREVHAVQLGDWDGTAPNSVFDLVVARIESKVGRTSSRGAVPPFVSQVPSNRTILVVPVRPDRVGLDRDLVHCETLEQVFCHFTPELTVSIEHEGGDTNEHLLRFSNLAEFQPDSILARIPEFSARRDGGETRRMSPDVSSFGEATRSRQRLRQIFERVRPLERTFRMLNGFYVNARSDRDGPCDSWVLNCSSDLLFGTAIFESLAAEIKSRFQSYSMSDVFSVLVIPDWATHMEHANRLAGLAFECKLQAVLGAQDHSSADSLVELFRMDQFRDLTGANLEKGNLLVVGNHVLGRRRHDFEDGDMYLCPATHLAGKMYQADERWGPFRFPLGDPEGKLEGVVATRFDISRPQVMNQITQLGVIPILSEHEEAFVMSSRSLSTAEHVGDVANVRVLDWLFKCIQDSLNRYGLTLFAESMIPTIEDELRGLFAAKLTGDGTPTLLQLSVAQETESSLAIELAIRVLKGTVRWTLSVVGRGASIFIEPKALAWSQ